MTIRGTARHARAVILRILLYLILVLSPVIVRFLSGGWSPGGLPRALAYIAGLVGFAMLTMQPVLSSRIRWICRPFGLDRVFTFHRKTGILAILLVILHPVLLAFSSGSLRLLLSLELPLFLLVARATLVLLILYGLAAMFHSGLRIPFQWWLRGHGALAPVILGGIFAHSYFTNIRFQGDAMRVMWFVLLGVGVLGYLHLNLLGRLGGRLRSWTVKRVDQEAHNVWTIELKPPARRKTFDYLPGQFLFITLFRERGLPREEHPFTISSSPTRKGSITITPKEVGDFTSTIGKSEPGHRAALMAPYGRFSYLLNPPTPKLVFVAGGIGITPLMSMLRYMRDTGSDKEVLLVQANRTEADIVFREELEEMERAKTGPHLQVVHVLENPEPSWQGRRGRVDAEMLRELVLNTKDTGFYICGPPGMMAAIASLLQGIDVPKQRIYMEWFSL
ncbi:oxidoreductase [Candidatus Fermentibacteria bacterium]|nr:oxidoreductase [Candidatus Fermentibacteria bacterium]